VDLRGPACFACVFAFWLVDSLGQLACASYWLSCRDQVAYTMIHAYTKLTRLTVICKGLVPLLFANSKGTTQIYGCCHAKHYLAVHQPALCPALQANCQYWWCPACSAQGCFVVVSCFFFAVFFIKPWQLCCLYLATKSYHTVTVWGLCGRIFCVALRRACL
jgi:hypothetical protein